MKRSDLLSAFGSLVISGGLYLLHPAVACLWVGGVLVGLGVVSHLKEAKKDKPQ